MARLELLFGMIDGLSHIAFDGDLQHSATLHDIQVYVREFWQIASLTGTSTHTLGRLLERFAGSIATDPRYKIYSLIGIAKPYSNVTPPIDYTIACPKVFVRATRYIFEDDQNLVILASSASGLA